MIDFLSDTMALSPPAMRDTTTRAALRDDVYRVDLTFWALEDRSVDLLGKESDIFIPTDTMGNVLVMMTHTRPGDELICGERHTLLQRPRWWSSAHCWRLHLAHASGAGREVTPRLDHAVREFQGGSCHGVRPWFASAEECE